MEEAVPKKKILARKKNVTATTTVTLRRNISSTTRANNKGHMTTSSPRGKSLCWKSYDGKSVRGK